MANLEKHMKPIVEQIDRADSSAVPTRARALHLIGRYIKNRRNNSSGHARARKDRCESVTLRLENLPPTPGNLERIRERVRILNQRLAASDAPLRLRVV